MALEHQSEEKQCVYLVSYEGQRERERKRERERAPDSRVSRVACISLFYYQLFVHLFTTTEFNYIHHFLLRYLVVYWVRP